MPDYKGSNSYSLESEASSGISIVEMTDRLQGYINDLEGLNGKGEKEFLTIGSNLNESHSSVVDISKTASSAAELILGKEIAKAIDDFQELRKKVRAYLDQVEIEIKQCNGKLLSIINIIKSIKKSVYDLKGIAKLLNMFALFTRIVVVNLSNHDSSLDTLVNNIKSMSKLINSRSNKIMKHMKTMSFMLNNAITTVHELETRQKNIAIRIVKDTEQGLASIRSMKKSSSSALEITKIITDRSCAVSKNISDVIVSLQSHDIVRQKMNQSIADLNNLLDILNSRDDLESDANNLDNVDVFPGVMISSLPIKTDISFIRDELIKAVKGIKDSLTGIAGNTAGLSAEIKEIAGSVSEDYQSFWDDMDQVMSSFTLSVKEDSDTSGKLSKVMKSVASMVSDISTCVSNIEEIGSDIKLIAFNARIKAAHIGEEGAAIGLLSEKIERLSVDSSEKTGMILDKLKEISGHIQELSRYEDSGVKIETVGLNDIVASLVDVLNPLHIVDQEIISHLNNMDENTTALVNDIKALTGGINVHNIASSVASDVISCLREIEESSMFAAGMGISNLLKRNEIVPDHESGLILEDNVEFF